MTQLFARKQLRLQPLAIRKHDLDISCIKELASTPCFDPKLRVVARRMVDARRKKRSIVLMMGGHVLRDGTQKYLIDLMERGYISCLAMNGSGMIHDFEFALIGATTESVARYIKQGEFGLWKETGRLNAIINKAYTSSPRIGMGGAVGKEIMGGKYPFKDTSVLAAGYRLDVPVTVHVGIGYDIVHEHPNCDGAATGALSYNDFLVFAEIVRKLEGGVVMNFGSAVMAPEVYLKALSMARNVARSRKRNIRKFTTLVADLHHLEGDISREPSRKNPAYYFRPWKTMLARTVADGGEGIYVMGKHGDTIPSLWTEVMAMEKRAKKT